jgi:hypothetical protein
LSQALCSACAFVSAAVLGRLTALPVGVDILITRDIRLAPARCVDIKQSEATHLMGAFQSFQIQLQIDNSGMMF